MYHWVPTPEVPDAGLPPGWPDQAAAEGWLTGAYLDLLDAGVTAVSLYEEDRLVYGPMSLEP
ncbi:MAG: hypothetical protein KIT69_05090 [Propionibacteriaceae bacterium]|nr:hypothetical protein [Propionibacteriaceae bacterium]